jgi:NAD-dependent SIR2 family protein deacetylase
VITTGAGMGVDSGLPDYRGDKGFWNSFPPFSNKFTFIECASPHFLKKHPNLF